MIPASIQQKADALLESNTRPRRSKRHGHKIINVSYRWRLVNKHGRGWQLMSHEQYNKSIKRG